LESAFSESPADRMPRPGKRAEAYEEETIVCGAPID